MLAQTLAAAVNVANAPFCDDQPAWKDPSYVNNVADEVMPRTSLTNVEAAMRILAVVEAKFIKQQRVGVSKGTIFIVSPTGADEADTLYQICCTTATDKAIRSSYDLDHYAEIGSRFTLEEAKKMAEQMGQSNPVII